MLQWKEQKKDKRVSVPAEKKHNLQKQCANLGTDGSVTVFMTFLFLILFLLSEAVLDSTRVFSSDGYVSVSAYGADVAMFGKYNRELFQEYQLFGYGGYEGRTEEDWIAEYENILLKNLTERPEGSADGEQSLWKKKYASVYRIRSAEVQWQKIQYLSQEECFLKQIDAWMKTAAWEDCSKALLNRIKGTDDGSKQEMLDSLETVEQQMEEQESGQKRGNGQQSGVEKEAAKKESEQEAISQSQNAAKGEQRGKENPIKFIKDLLRDGVLFLVCDEERLSKNVVQKRENVAQNRERIVDEPEDTGSSGKKRDWYQQKTETGMLKALLQQSDSLWNQEMLQDQKKKGKLLLYASQMLDCYLEETGKSAHYGLEYLITGKEVEKDNICSIVNRLLMIRTLLNFAYVNSSLSLQEQSLATATEIAAPLCAEAFIPVIQQTILLILALEEAFVDVTALLQGRMVPLMKNQTSFRMNYSELCLASKGLFQKKAATYPREDKSTQLQQLSQGLGYMHYLWLLLMMTSWEKLYERTLDLIQDDVRNRYNDSFQIGQCICGTTLNVRYSIPLLSPVWMWEEEGEIAGKQGVLSREIKMSYEYQ